MQFKVPQNIDMEDKIVGPLTLIQFLYLLAGGILDYILFQTLTQYMAIFLLLAIPITVTSLALAFFKIQDQPISHFFTAGMQYLSKPKVRYWKRAGNISPILLDIKKEIKKQVVFEKKAVEKSDLEKLAYVLDTRPMAQHEQQNFGKITDAFEKMVKRDWNDLKKQQQQQQGGGNSGAMGQQPANRAS